MRTIGLIGGISWESSAHYYRIINQQVRGRLGGNHSAEIAMVSVDFVGVEAMQMEGDWAGLGRRMADAARKLDAAGAELILLCSNTMHRVADAIEEATAVPLLYIADPTAEAVKAAGIGTVGLLGTAFTMEQGFYIDRLRQRHGLEVLVPEAGDRALVHDVIYRELVTGVVRPTSREVYRAVIGRLVDRGAEAIILGCTEIMLLVGRDDAAVPLFDTTELHARAAVNWALRA